MILVNDKTLLKILLAGALVTAISIVFVPFETMESDNLAADHGVQQQLVSQANSALAAGEGNAEQLHKLAKSLNVLRSESEIAQALNVRRSKSEAKTANKQTTTTRNATYYQPPVKYHTVFSTGCSTFQDWQSYVFFYHALQSGQEGHITRIASGCHGETKDTLEKIFKDEIASMDPERLHLHQTPEFGKVGGLKRAFKYFNKPFGMRHWFENVLGYPENHAEHDDSIVILLDPDQILLRPFTNDFTNSAETWRLKDDNRHKLKVEHGSPFSQQYGYGLQWWKNVNQTYVFDGPTPVATMTKKEAADYYSAMGPPYVATAKDMYAIVKQWSDIVPRVRDEYPHLLAEMFAFNIAAAHLGLRHTLAFSFMVSDVGTGGEGWPLVEEVDAKDVCHNYPKSQYPHVIHYCQRYVLGKWFIGKYRLRKDFISCDAPLLTVPPGDIALRYKRGVMPNGNIKDMNPRHVKFNAFMVCAMISALNEAAVYYKDHHCDKATANYNYTYTFFEDMSMAEDGAQ